MKKNFLVISVGLIGILIAFGVQGFGFDKNIENRKSADTESVAGCMQSCEDMMAGWLEMNPESPNYTRQHEKIAAKAEQCLAMNELAGFPYSEEEILQSCGLEPRCVEVSEENVFYGACTGVLQIEEMNLPQCCGIEDPLRGINCGEDEEWVVGVAAQPACYIPGS